MGWDSWFDRRRTRSAITEHDGDGDVPRPTKTNSTPRVKEFPDESEKFEEARALRGTAVESNLSQTLRSFQAATATTLLTTLGASVIASGITYPVEQWRLQWEQATLKKWDLSNSATDGGPVRFPNTSTRVLKPFFRVWTNHLASNMVLGTMLWMKPPTSTTDKAIHGTSSSSPTISFDSWSQLQAQLLAGSLAGLVQVALLLPLELAQANHKHLQELRQARSWRHWLDHHFSLGSVGTTRDPLEQHQRVLRGLRLLVAREVLFNVTFFPVFQYLKDHPGWNTTLDGCEIIPTCSKDTCTNNSALSSSLAVLVASGVGAGMVFALAVTPMDVAQTYFRHSRQVWHWWTGLSMMAPPLHLLGRGLLLQACCFGPSFGLVAAIYELT